MIIVINIIFLLKLISKKYLFLIKDKMKIYQLILRAVAAVAILGATTFIASSIRIVLKDIRLNNKNEEVEDCDNDYFDANDDNRQEELKKSQSHSKKDLLDIVEDVVA
ncbi:hypothetical protein PVAND_013735 [Polypedilum vanderplanki]|uniref:Uncharacterized protein n=1 Tax=Polypedilum vanderplanki TaxID=319348 RepID=A0A9J6CQA9_POLVA|nr:hypothetical protein PVAND_013735 [Polypedilum vanderplanki]